MEQQDNEKRTIDMCDTAPVRNKVITDMIRSVISSRFLSTAMAPPKIYVAVVGVGLVGSELVDQILAIPPQSSPFHLISLTSSSRTLFNPANPIAPGSPWKSQLSASTEKADLSALTDKLARLVSPNQKVAVVDNTSSEVVASLYPAWLGKGINVVTPNKKAYSGDLGLYESILAASGATGARYLNEATVGAGLPVISTLKELVATGDKVNLQATLSVVSSKPLPPGRLSKLKVYSLEP